MTGKQNFIDFLNLNNLPNRTDNIIPTPSISQNPFIPLLPMSNTKGYFNNDNAEFFKDHEITTATGEIHHGHNQVEGDLQCKYCYQIKHESLNFYSHFKDIKDYLTSNFLSLHDRAPGKWMKPVLKDCQNCNKQNCMMPLIFDNQNINWLFLFLGEMLGCCRLDQLKYFCKAADIYRTGAKNRILLSVYVHICTKLDHEFPLHPCKKP